MAEFKSITDTETVDKRYVNKVIVYLESPEDVAILAERWFFDIGENLEFKPSDQGYSSTGGCSGVCQSVEIDRSNGVIAFGIVDRDALLSKRLWDLIWETDNVQYLAAAPFGPYIRPLIRWEIENYLIAPEVVEEYLADHEHGRTQRSSDDIIIELLKDCDALIPMMAACALLHEHGVSAPGDGYLKQEFRTELEECLCTQYISYKLKDIKDWQGKFENNKCRVQLFDNQSIEGKERLESLLRIIDGKRLLERLKYRHNVKDDPRFHLARKIREIKCVPDEIKLYVFSLVLNKHETV